MTLPTIIRIRGYSFVRGAMSEDYPLYVQKRCVGRVFPAGGEWGLSWTNRTGKTRISKSSGFSTPETACTHLVSLLQRSGILEERQYFLEGPEEENEVWVFLAKSVT